MSCSQVLNGIIRDCLPNQGGVAEIYAIAHENVSEVTVGDNIITAITLASDSKFTKYYLPKGTANMVSTPTIDRATGVNYVATDLTIQFNRMSASKHIEVSALLASELAVIVKDANGVYWYLGKDEPVLATGGSGQTGTARTDGNFYQVILQDNSAMMPMEVDAAIVDSLLS